MELGLGTGLNFMKTVESFLESSGATSLFYTAIEINPLPAATIQRLGTTNDPTQKIATDLLLKALSQPKKPIGINSPKEIQFNLRIMPWQDHKESPLNVDAYYHDPFAPKDNPLCWSTECFEWAKSHLSPEGIVATYSASSAIRRAMAQAGLFVAKRDGACGKREMTLAAQSPQLLNAGKLLPNNKQPPVNNEVHEL